MLFESTGLYGKSEVRRVDPQTGHVLARKKLEKNLFGEGIAVVGNIVYMLTWKEKKLLMFDSVSLEVRIATLLVVDFCHYFMITTNVSYCTRWHSLLPAVKGGDWPTMESI